MFIIVCNNGFKLHRISTESTNSDGSFFRAKDAGANPSAPLARGHNARHPPFSGSERQAMHHSMLIQGLLTNGTFERIDPYKYRNPTITSITVLFTSNPSYSKTWILLMWSRTRMTRSKRSLLVTTRSVKSLPSSTPWLIPRSPYLRRHRVMGVSGSSSPTPSFSPMPQIFEKFSVWKGEQSFCLFRSVDRTWLISREIAKWSKCIHCWSDPPIWRLRTRTTICSPR